MEPTLAAGIVTAAIDVLVYHVRILSTESLNFLLEPRPCVLHQCGVTLMPKLTMALDSALYAFADGFDDVLVHHLAVKWREFLMPVHDLQGISGRTHSHRLRFTIM
jgi:hypothetical protein